MELASRSQGLLPLPLPSFILQVFRKISAVVVFPRHHKAPQHQSWRHNPEADVAALETRLPSGWYGGMMWDAHWSRLKDVERVFKYFKSVYENRHSLTWHAVSSVSSMFSFQRSLTIPCCECCQLDSHPDCKSQAEFSRAVRVRNCSMKFLQPLTAHVDARIHMATFASVGSVSGFAWIADLNSRREG